MNKLLLLFALLFISNISFSQVVGGDQPLPSIKVKTLEGNEVDLKDYAENGKITIIGFWATWCKPCKEELENINALLSDWQKKYDVELVAVSIDNARNAMKVKPYVEGKGWDFDVLLDMNEDTKRTLNFSAIPYSLVVDQSGNIVYKHSGYYEGDEFELEDLIKSLSSK